MASNKFEPYLASPARTVAVLEKFGFTFKKQYGQNFLIDGNILEGIIEGAGITKNDTVVEIGPGIGTLTQYLSVYARDVVAVEIDDRLIPVLEDTLKDCDNVTVVHGDILKQDVPALVKERQEMSLDLYQDNVESSGFHVVANLPYYITTPIVMGLLEKDINVKSITVMVQSEVADRMKAAPGSKDYGALSLAVQYYAKPEKVLDAAPNCFIPKPRVGSTVVSLKKYENPPITTLDKDFMFKVIHGAFAQRRKTLINSLSHAGIEGVNKEKIEDALSRMQLDLRIRGEALTLEQFATLSDILNY